MSEQSPTLTVVIPCFNEEPTLRHSVGRVLAIASQEVSLEVIIVDDASSDASLSIARELAEEHANVRALHHEQNQGKGAALRTGFQHATGDYVAVQDADLEYNPQELLKLLEPLQQGKADVVYGSRFASSGAHRVLYFWHSLGNRFLTFLSNMFTDLNLTDMETCYKVFKREIIQSIEIEENRFGFEPEITAKIAQRRLRIYEMGISYDGRTYEEGKKIGVSDGFRALYCIFRYNLHKAPVPVQFLIYLFIGGFSALVNLGIFLSMHGPMRIETTPAVITAYILAAVVNYLLCIWLLFRHKARWNRWTEMIVYAVVVIVALPLDLYVTLGLMSLWISPGWSKLLASVTVFIFNFLGRRFLVFPEKSSGPWRPMSGK